jgi:hypothetical protein
MARIGTDHGEALESAQRFRTRSIDRYAARLDRHSPFRDLAGDEPLEVIGTGAIDAHQAQRHTRPLGIGLEKSVVAIKAGGSANINALGGFAGGFFRSFRFGSFMSSRPAAISAGSRLA